MNAVRIWSAVVVVEVVIVGVETWLTVHSMAGHHPMLAAVTGGAGAGAAVSAMVAYSSIRHGFTGDR